MGHYVYKYVYNGEIVYIGKNDTKIENRIKQHQQEEKFKPYLNSDIYYCVLPNRIMSDVVESELIRRYKPRLNVAKTSNWSGIDFKEPKWIKYQENPDIQSNKRKKVIISNIAFNSLPKHTQLLYLYMKIHANTYTFNFPFSLAVEYQLYSRSDSSSFYTDISLLVQNGFIIKEKNTKSNLYIFSDKYDDRILKQRLGIEKAKKEGKYKGRQKKKIDEDKFNTLYQRYMNREITKDAFAKTLGVSRPTLDKIIKEKI